jgi:anaerobic selenocysteine-containing dehydrogenase
MTEKKNSTWREKAEDLLVSKDGSLTRKLLLEPASFGLGKVPSSVKPDQTTSMVCGFCSTGCSLQIHMKGDEAVNLTPNTHYPVNLGMACPKGWEALTPLRAPDRATTPMVRVKGKLVPVSWEQGLDNMVRNFKAIAEKHGPASLAYISTGQIATEEMALLGAVAKFGMGMIHGDGNTRQCMATAVVSYKQSFGFDAPPYTYQDFEESDVIVLVGSNLCIAHPIMWERVVRNKNKPAIVVIDPRRTETAMASTHHYAPAPKSDMSLFYAIARLLIERGQIDQKFIEAHTEGFEEFSRHVEAFSLARAAAETGLSEVQIVEFADLIANGKRVSFWWTMGVNQSHQGVRTAQALINLALMTGNIGRPGTGANSITGQCNAMGSRLFSNTTNLLGGRDFTNEVHRNEVAGILGIDVEKIPSVGSLAYDQILEGILRGKIKGLWIIATNPVHSWINQGFVKDILSRLDFLVVQDMYNSTETVAFADLLLPAAGWGEKEGTFINSERRFGIMKRVARAPGQALTDFNIFRLVAEAWGCGDMFKEWTSPAAAFQILKRLSKGRPCDITGIEDHAMVDREGGVQWPLREGETLSNSQRRLFEDGKFYHENGRAKFIQEEPRPLPEPANAKFPLTLLTGRGSSSQWHTETRTKKSAVLNKLSARDLYVEISPTDAKALKISPNEWVEVKSARGRVDARAFITNNVRAGQVFMPMHYEEMNVLTFAAFDPYSRQPAYKACAVAVGKPGP